MKMGCVDLGFNIRDSSFFRMSGQSAHWVSPLIERMGERDAKEIIGRVHKCVYSHVHIRGMWEVRRVCISRVLGMKA